VLLRTMVADTSLGLAGMVQGIVAGNSVAEDTAEVAEYAEGRKQTAWTVSAGEESDYNTAYGN
jgi:hypothetical protein